MVIRKELPVWRRAHLWLIVGIPLLVSSFASNAWAIAAKDPISYIIDQLNPLIPDFRTPSGWKIRVGAVAGFTPQFEGSSDYKLRVAPLVDVIYRDRLFLNSNRLRVNLLPSGDIRGGIQVKYRAGRKERISEDLLGLGDVGASWEAGLYIEGRFHATVISADLTHDIGSGHKSTLASLLIGQGIYQDDNTVLGVGVNVHWAGKSYMKAFFGIDPAQSAASGLPVFNAGSGFKDAGLLLYWRQDFGEHVALLTSVTYKHMLDAAQDSPLIQTHGSTSQFISSVGLRYAF
jgi:outer membrane protein